MESRDGGATWAAKIPEGDPWDVGTKGVFFLRNQATGEGDGDTWLVTDNGFWRTSDAGETWDKVSDAGSPHGTNDFFYASNGDLYAGAWQYLQKSTDNGLTWVALSNLPYSVYYSVAGDGDNLYAMADTSSEGYYTSPETDGLNWSLYESTSNPTRGPIKMHFEPVNRIMYSSNWDGGFWAMKVLDP
jgi:photosystem II stability/assembly factor-like uncharacterized protein